MHYSGFEGGRVGHRVAFELGMLGRKKSVCFMNKVKS